MPAAILALLLFVEAPVLPPRCRPDLYAIHHRIGLAASKGDWDAAARELANWPTGDISYQLPDDPKLRSAAQEAARILEALSDGEWRFRPGYNAPIRFVWTDQHDPTRAREWTDELGSTASSPQNGDHSVLIARLPTRLASADAQVADRSYVAAIAKTFALYVGLDESQARFSLMGPDIYVASSPSIPPIGASQEERVLIRRLIEARKTWERIVRDRTPVRYTQPRLIVTPQDVDLGAVERGPDLKAPFTFRNEGDAETLIEFESSCQCILAETPPSLAPRSEKVIEAIVQSRDMLGKIRKTITIYTNDPVEPVKHLSVSLLAVPPIRVIPDTLKQVTLREEGPTSFEFIFYSPSPKPIHLTRVDVNAEGVASRIEPFNGIVEDPLFDHQPIRRVGYKVTLTFSESFPAGLNWVRVVFLTDLPTAPYLDVTLETHKGILTIPKTIWFGNAAIGQPVVRTVTLQHGETAFEIERVEATDGVQVSIEPADESRRQWRLNATWTPKAAGRVNGEIVVHTNSKRFPRISIPFSGIAQ